MAWSDSRSRHELMAAAQLEELTPVLPSNAECHGADDEADLARCIEQAVAEFLHPSKEDNLQPEVATSYVAPPFNLQPPHPWHYDKPDVMSGSTLPTVAAALAAQDSVTEEAHWCAQMHFAYEAQVEQYRPVDRRRRRADGGRFSCNFHLTQAYQKLNVVPAIIGKQGVNTRSIYEKTGAKIRVRGRGSGHKESATGREAPAGLMVTVSACASDLNAFNHAVTMTGELLDRIQTRIRQLNEARDLGELCWHVNTHTGQSFRLVDGKLVPADMAPRIPVTDGYVKAGRYA
ncbi:unnamed protein product [Effrenium voratum]|uniref:KHDC4/BBP-like KH-domain type I domain-containing protein n=1 Tax=Effrenium voratum TaxID=2562239 RepID=A0AA36IG99_9DINO|nr:unnamed protein product [Effrenium voratum]